MLVACWPQQNLLGGRFGEAFAPTKAAGAFGGARLLNINSEFVFFAIGKGGQI